MATILLYYAREQKFKILIFTTDGKTYWVNANVVINNFHKIQYGCLY